MYRGFSFGILRLWANAGVGADPCGTLSLSKSFVGPCQRLVAPSTIGKLEFSNAEAFGEMGAKTDGWGKSRLDNNCGPKPLCLHRYGNNGTLYNADGHLVKKSKIMF